MGKVVVAVNSNHTVAKAEDLQARNLLAKNRLTTSAICKPADDNVAAVRVNLPLRSNLLCRAMPGIG